MTGKLILAYWIGRWASKNGEEFSSCPFGRRLESAAWRMGWEFETRQRLVAWYKSSIGV